MTSRPIRFILFSISLVLIISSCNKINEATDVGDEIIPGVDGVNTFDTTIADLETYNTIFDPVKDSVRVERGDDHILGNIVSDPFFGKTNAKIFLELKPTFYPWNFSDIHNKDSLYLDSVVLVLGWSATYGDTMAPQRVRAWEMDQSNNFRIDSFYSLRDQYFTYSNLLGTKDFLPSQLKDSVKVFQDTTAGQLRIRLNDAFGRRLLDYDTTNAYKSDSAFKSYLKGFAIDADQSFGNALMAFGLADNPNTNLAIYYRYRKGGQDDTTVSYFQFTGFSARHNYIERFDFAGTPLQAASNTPAEDDLIYLINTPGSFATVKIPVLRNLSSRLINRAELIVEEVFDPSDKTFTPPEGLMLDVYDSTLDDYKFLPYDYAPDQTGLSNIGFGMYGKRTVDAFGNPIRVWKFVITRYVQNIITKQEPLHDFRLFTAKNVIERLKEGYASNTGSYTYFGTQVNSRFAFGRVRVGGGKHPSQKIRLRIIYTKI